MLSMCKEMSYAILGLEKINGLFDLYFYVTENYVIYVFFFSKKINSSFVFYMGGD